MYTEIPSLTRCCFCAPLRYGLMVWAYLKLVFNMVLFGCGLIWLSIFSIFMFVSEYDIHFLISLITGMVLYVSDIIFSFVLIIGIHKKHTTLLRIFLRFGIAHTLLFVTDWLMIVGFLLLSASEIYWDAAWHFLDIFLCLCCIFIILQTYLLLLVRSEICKLKTNAQFQFVNHTPEPKCVMQADSSPINKEKEILTENPLP